MTLDETSNCNKIDTFIQENRSFALWRIPGDDIRFAMQTSGSARLLYHIEELDGQSGFVIAPFHVCPEQPIVLIRPDIEEIPSAWEKNPLRMKQKSPAHRITRPTIPSVSNSSSTL